MLWFTGGVNKSHLLKLLQTQIGCSPSSELYSLRRHLHINLLWDLHIADIDATVPQTQESLKTSCAARHLVRQFNFKAWGQMGNRWCQQFEENHCQRNIWLKGAVRRSNPIHFLSNSANISSGSARCCWWCVCVCTKKVFAHSPGSANWEKSKSHGSNHTAKQQIYEFSE